MHFRQSRISLVCLSLTLLLIASSVSSVPPPSNNNINDLINNPFLDSKVYEQYTKYDFSSLLSGVHVPENHEVQVAKDPTLKRARDKDKDQTNTGLKRPRRTSYTEEERRAAKREADRKAWPKKYNRLMNTPEGLSARLAKLERDRKYSQNRRAKFNNLPDGHEKKEEHIKYARSYMKTWREKKRAQDPDYETRKSREYRENVKNLANSSKATSKRGRPRKKLPTKPE